MMHRMRPSDALFAIIFRRIRNPTNSRWLERRRLPLAALDEGRLTQFLATLRRRGEARRGDPATGQQLLGYLRDRDDIAAAAQRIDRTAAACLTRDFEEFLHCERGLSRSTVVSYLPVVRCHDLRHNSESRIIPSAASNDVALRR